MIQFKTREQSNGHYKMFTDKSDNKAMMKFNGFLPLDGVENFIADYESLKKSVQPSETTLIIEASELKVFPRNLEPNLGQLYKDYTCFKKIYLVAPKQLVTKMQFQRIFRENNLTSYFEFVDNTDAIK